MSGLSDGRRSSLGLWVGVVLAAFVCAWLLVRAMRSADETSRALADAGDPKPLGDPRLPPSRALGNEGSGVSRCSEASPSVALGEGDLSRDSSLAVGEAILEGNGLVAVGLARTKGDGRQASVATFRVGESKVALTDLGPIGGDDPPPKPFEFQGSLLAARIETTRERRRLVVSSVAKIAADGATTPFSAEQSATVQTRDESLAFDVAADGIAAIVVWDDDDAGRGVIRAARLGGSPFVVSPKASDAESPRVVADGHGGAFIAWVARKVEGDAGEYAIERGAETPEARWVEVTHLKHDATQAGAPIRLAPTRIGGFDIARADRGQGLLFVGREEDGDVLGRGARLVRQDVQLQAERDGQLIAEPPILLLRDGVGGAEPQVLSDGAGGLVAFGDLSERIRLLSLLSVAAEPSAPDAGAPSLEPLLENGRLLAGRAASLVKAPGLAHGKGGKRGTLGVATVSRGGRSEAHIVLCER